MWLQSLLLTVLALGGEVRAAAEAKMTELDVVNYYRQNPMALPPNARKIFLESERQLSLQKRQSSVTVALLGSLQNTLDSASKKLPTSNLPMVQEFKSPKFPEARRKKIRYGPYRIPPVSEKNVEFRMLNQKGMTNTLKIGARKPCGKECIVLDINASLEDAEGKPVPSTPEGAWLHHCVLLNVGLNVRDATCGGISEHVFEAGNEKSDSPYYSPPSGVKSGYHVRNDDIFVINTELMNMEDKEKWAWVTLDYDYIEGFQPEWKEGKIVWMSIGPNRCTGSELNPFGITNLTRTQQPMREVFMEYSVPWTAPADGLILGANCHLHDGGTSTKYFLEENMVCQSDPVYSQGPGNHLDGPMRKAKRQMGVHLNSDIDHIAEQPACIFSSPKPIKKGQDLYIKADYDFTKHPGMRNKDNELDEVMAIAGALIAFDFPFN